MWWSFRTPVQAVVEPTQFAAPSDPTLPRRPVPLPINRESVLPKEYSALCSSLDYDPDDLIQAQFETLLLTINQPLFNFLEVMDYLDRIRPRGQDLVWASFTAKDWVAASTHLGCNCKDPTHSESQRFPRPISFLKRPYSRLIPADVLKRLAHIRKTISPERAPFFISDFAVQKPDPFVMTFFYNRVIVFDAWDEPGFGM